MYIGTMAYITKCYSIDVGRRRISVPGMLSRHYTGPICSSNTQSLHSSSAELSYTSQSPSQPAASTIRKINYETYTLYYIKEEVLIL